MKNIILKIVLCFVLFFCANTLVAQEYTFEDDKTPIVNNKQETKSYLGFTFGINPLNEDDIGFLFGMYYTERFNSWFGMQIEGLVESCDGSTELHIPLLLQANSQNFTLETGLMLDIGIDMVSYDFTAGIPVGLKWKSNPFYVGKTANRISLGLRYVYHFSDRRYNNYYWAGYGRYGGHNSLQITLSWELGRPNWGIVKELKRQFNR